MTKWTLIDGKEMHEQHPDTFDIPTQAEWDLIEGGSIVKIGYSGTDGGERFWVEVLGVGSDGFYGRVVSELYHTASHGMYLNNGVFFERRNVLDIA